MMKFFKDDFQQNDIVYVCEQNDIVYVCEQNDIVYAKRSQILQFCVRVNWEILGK